MFNIFYQILNNFTKNERYIFSGIAIIFTISSVIWGILIFQTATVKIPVSSNKYREGIVGQPIAINPILVRTNDADRDLVELIFSDLLDIIETYNINKDGQVWNIVLKPDLHWSDGKPLTSDDIIFTIDTIQNLESQSPLSPTWQGVVINRISEREIEFVLRTPYAFFLDNIEDLKIIPKHIFGIIPAANIRLSNFNLEPIGNGPYKFVSFEKRKDGFITDFHLVTNEYFAGEKPFIKEFDIRFYPDATKLINAFNLKRIDGFGGLNPKNIEDLKLNHKILEKNTSQYYAIFINKNTSPSLDDDNIRAALNLAINKQKIVEQVFDGKALIVNGPILPIIAGYDRAADPGNEFSLEKASEILDKKKWLPNKKNGVREKKIGKKLESLEFSIVVPQIPFLTKTIDIIKEDFRKIGIKLNPIILNPTDIVQEVIKTRNYQLIIFGNVLRDNPDIFSFWHSSERFYPGLNLALYKNEKVDTLIESIRKNFDEKSRNSDLSKLQTLISKNNPAIFLYSPIYLYVGPKDLGGFEEKIITTSSDRFDNVHKWYLETARVFK